MSHPVAEIFSQGEEVITGQVADTNAAWLSQRLVQMGFVIARHTAVGDKLQDLCDLLLEISGRADFCLCTGGLGPTIDDLTAQAVAKAFDCPLQLDPVALAQIERYFLNRNKVMADTNRKQACFPKGVMRLDNAWVLHQDLHYSTIVAGLYLFLVCQQKCDTCFTSLLLLN